MSRPHLDVIIQIARLSDGTRKLISLQEVVGMEGDLITLQELFVFQQTGLDENRKVKGRFKATGVRPKFAERLAAKGVALAARSVRSAKGVRMLTVLIALGIFGTILVFLQGCVGVASHDGCPVERIVRSNGSKSGRLLNRRRNWRSFGRNRSATFLG